MATTTTTETVKAVKAGDWVLPIDVNGETVHALQINKSKEDKENIKEIKAEYDNAGITVYEYAGKNGNPVLLVDATQKLRSQRTSQKRSKFIETMLKMGMDIDKANAAYAEYNEK